MVGQPAGTLTMASRWLLGLGASPISDCQGFGIVEAQEPPLPPSEDKRKNIGKMTENGAIRPDTQPQGPAVFSNHRLFTLARRLKRLLVEDPGAGNLGGDQEGREHGRHADETQKLIQ
jgi:hypothetical protein